MPAISDPGTLLVRAAIDAGHDVRPVPGASALTSALAVSGLDTSRVAFEGFLPRQGAKRRTRIDEIARERRTTVMFEAPHRIARTLADLVEACGAHRPVCLAREMTKSGSVYYILPRVWEARAEEVVEAQVEDSEMGGERQGDEAVDADRDEESEAVGRMASVSAGVGARAGKRKSVESIESVESASGGAKPVDDELELDEAIEKAMESGRAGLAEDADEDTRIAFFLKGAERSNGPGGLEEQIQAKVKAGGIRQLSLSCDALSMELRELEERQGNLRVAMQEATARVEASKVHSALVQMRMKRQRA
jgi:hypothetical protein